MLDRTEVHCDCIGMREDIKFLTRKNSSQESVPHPRAEGQSRNTKISLRKTRVFSHQIPEQPPQLQPTPPQEVEPLNLRWRRNQPDPQPFFQPIHTTQIQKNRLDIQQKYELNPAPSSSTALPLRQSAGWAFFSLQIPLLQTQKQTPTNRVTSARNLNFLQEQSRRNTEQYTIPRAGNPSRVQIKGPMEQFTGISRHPPLSHERMGGLSQERMDGPNRALIMMPSHSFHLDEPGKLDTIKSLEHHFVMDNPNIPPLLIGHSERARSQGPNSQRNKNPYKSAQDFEDKGPDKLHTKRSKETDRFKSLIQAHSPTGEVRMACSVPGSSSSSSEQSIVVPNDFGKNFSECVEQGQMGTIATKESHIVHWRDNGFEQGRQDWKTSQHRLTREGKSTNFF